MRSALMAVLVFGFLVWDMSKNRGLYSRAISASFGDVARQVNLR